MSDYLIPGARWSRRDFLSRMALVSGAAATGASLAGSRGLVASAAAADAGTINVLTLGEGIFGDPFVKLSPEFTKLTGIKVNNVTMGYNETMQKQAAVFAAHGTDLDVVGVDYMFLKGYAKAGHLASLDKLIPKAQLDDYYSDTPANLKFVWSLDGETYGLATVGNCQNFIYNAGHLAEVGLQPPDTWNDLLAAAQKVVDPGKNRYGFVAGTERLTKAVTVWLPMYWANGGEIFDDKMHPIFASDTGVRSLEFLLELMKTMPPGGGAYTESDEVKALSVGLATLDPASWIPTSSRTPTKRPSRTSRPWWHRPDPRDARRCLAASGSPSRIIRRTRTRPPSSSPGSTPRMCRSTRSCRPAASRAGFPPGRRTRPRIRGSRR